MAQTAAFASVSVSVPPYIWYPILTSLGLGFMFMNIPPVADQFMTLFGVGHGGLGFVLSGLYWAHALFQVPAGLVVDRLGIVKSLLLAFVVIILANLIPLLAPGSLVLAISMRFCLGLAAGVMFLSVVKTVGSLAPPARMARAQGIQGASFSLGTMLPYCSLPYMGTAAWSYSYLIVAMFGAAGLIATLFLPREQLNAVQSHASLRQVWEAVKTIPTSKAIWILGCFHGLAYGSLNNLGNWLPSVLVDLDGRTTLESWAMAAGGIMLVGTLARAFGGEMLRFMSRPQLVGRAVLVIACLYFLLALSPFPVFVIGISVLMALVCGSTYGSVFTLTIGSVSPAYVATAVGFMNMIANLVNVSLIMVMGNGREWTGHFTMSFTLLGAAALLAWIIGRNFRLPQRQP